MAMREEVLYEIFFDLHKAYDALDCGLCLDTFAAYGIGPRELRILWRYWGCLLMLARTGGYYGALFKGHHGLTHWDLLSPTIFNVVVDVVLRH